MARYFILYFILLSALIDKSQACFCDHYPWTQWTSCSKTCNSGTQSRWRQTVIDKYYLENSCDELCTKQETRECNWQACPINCLLGDYGPWSDCDPCVEKQFKVRSILRPSQFGGQPCTEPLVTFQPCIPTKLCNIEEIDCKNKFRCDTGRCIASKLECNGENDCGDNSDERNCGRTKAICPRKYNPIPNVHMMGNGFHILAGEPKGEVLDSSFTGGICKTAKSVRESNPYRVSANLENVNFEVETKEDELETDFFKDLIPFKENKDEHSLDMGQQNHRHGSIFYSSSNSHSFNHNSAFKQAIEASHKKDSSFIRIHKAIKVLNFTMKSKDLQLSDVFLKSLNHLPLEYNYALYSRIFDDFGTHYFTSGSLGGVYDLLYQFSSEELKNSGLTEKQMRNCVRIETKKRIAFFFTKKSVKEKCTTNKMSEKYEGSFLQGSEKSISFVKGGRSEYAAALAWKKEASDPEEKVFSEWLKSVKDNPAVIDFELAPITDLVRNIPCAVTRRNNLRKAFREYAAKFDPCQCAPCPNNGRPTLSGSECLCVCQSGTYGENCERRSPDYKSSAVDGNWGCWSSWSSCDATYKRSRTRECNNPAHSLGGKPCEGQKRQEEHCTFSIMENNGQPCISDDEDIKEVDLPEVESDTECSQPVPPENGFIRNVKKLYSVGEDAEISCYTGFKIVGYQYFRCLPDRTWRQLDVECQRTQCLKPVVQEVLKVSPFQGSYEIGESIELICPKGFVISGPSTYTCTEDSWTPSISNSLTCENEILKNLKGHCQLGQKQLGSECICMSPEEDCSPNSEDLCVFDSDSSHNFTSSACKFLAKKCLNNQQLHFLHIGSCQDGPQLEWGLERTKLSSNSTKRESCGYDTCYDWEKCSASTSKCVCLLPSQCSKGGNQLYCVRMGSSMSKKTVNICEVGTIRCAKRKMEILHSGRCLA